MLCRCELRCELRLLRSRLCGDALLFGLGASGSEFLPLACSLNLAVGDGTLLAIAPSHPGRYAFDALLGRSEQGCAGRKAHGEDETVEDTLHAEWPDPGLRFGESLAAEGWAVDFDEALLSGFQMGRRGGARGGRSAMQRGEAEHSARGRRRGALHNSRAKDRKSG